MRLPGLLIALFLCIPLHGFGQTIYAVVLGNQKYVVGSSTLHSGLFRSSDRGRSWTHLGPENLKAYSMDAVDSSRGGILYLAAGNGVHRSTDGGASWKIITDWRMTEVMDVKVDQHDPRWIYAATASGLWRSGDGGEHWENPKGPLQKRYCYRILIDPVTGTIAVTTENGVAVFFDHGTSPVSDIAPRDPKARLPANQQWVLPVALRNPRVILPVNEWWVALGSETGPELWLRDIIFPSPNPSHLSTPDSIWLRCQSTHPVMNTYALALAGDTLYAGGESGLWRFEMSGKEEWVDISDSIPGGIVHAIALLPESGDMLVGTFGEGLYRREGRTWIASGLEGSQVWSLVVKEY